MCLLKDKKNCKNLIIEKCSHCNPLLKPTPPTPPTPPTLKCEDIFETFIIKSSRHLQYSTRCCSVLE